MQIYFIQAESGPVKIGTSASAHSRLTTLQTANHEHLTLLGLMDGGEVEEAAWHRRFSHLRIHGEWFEPGADLLAAIDLACARDDPPSGWYEAWAPHFLPCTPPHLRDEKWRAAALRFCPDLLSDAPPHPGW